MQALIQQFLFPKQLKVTESLKAQNCNYPNNYYGDQICSLVRPSDGVHTDQTTDYKRVND